MIPILWLETLNHIGDSHLAVKTEPLLENTLLEREKWMGHKFHSTKTAKLKCVSLLCISVLAWVFSRLLFSKMQTVFASIWDNHIHKPTLLEQKMLNQCPLYNRLCLYRRNVHVQQDSLETVVYYLGKLPWKRLGEAILVPQVGSDCHFYFVDHQRWKTHGFPWHSIPVLH